MAVSPLVLGDHVAAGGGVHGAAAAVGVVHGLQALVGQGPHGVLHDGAARVALERPGHGLAGHPIPQARQVVGHGHVLPADDELDPGFGLDALGHLLPACAGMDLNDKMPGARLSSDHLEIEALSA